MKEIYVSTGGGTVSGTQSTNALAGTVAVTTRLANGTAATAAAAQIAGDTARNQANNSLANTGHGATSTGAAVSTAAETMVPLSAFSHFGPGNTPLAVNHQGLFVAATISFNLAPGVALSQAQQQIDNAVAHLDMPATVHGSFQGTAQVFEQSLANEPILIAAALVAVYIVLGVLYESYVHPLTILSTLPSAGVGAVLALIVTGTEFSIIALIGVILLIGIVKKNAIMMIDFALDAERTLGLSSREAIYQACLKRFRPIIMTTLGGDARRAAAGDRLWRGRRIAPPARHFDRRRADGQPGADPLHDAGHLSLPRPVSPVGAAALENRRAAPRPPAGSRTRRMKPAALKGVAAVAAAIVSACTVGPDYLRPSAPVPAQYKEATAPPGWKLGQPADALSRGAWWTIYNDPVLDGLETADRHLQPEPESVRKRRSARPSSSSPRPAPGFSRPPP